MQTQDRLSEAIRSLKTALVQVVECVDDLTRIIDDLRIVHVDTGAKAIPLRIDQNSFVVYWRDRHCHLGYTLAFRLLEALARRPNQYLSIDYLLSEIWSGQRSRTAVRSAVSDLRHRLMDAEMEDLAAMIDGSNRGHYGLMLSRR